MHGLDTSVGRWIAVTERPRCILAPPSLWQGSRAHSVRNDIDETVEMMIPDMTAHLDDYAVPGCAQGRGRHIGFEYG